MKERGNRKVMVGTVVSDRMDKTVVVQSETLVKDPVYKKYVRRFSKHKAHDEKNECRLGDRVEIVESRPLSKHKRWRVRKVLERTVV